DQDVLADAEVVVRARFVNQRLAPVPMEPNAVLAAPDPETGGLVVWASCQGPFVVRGAIASALRMDPATVRVIAPDVGGGFGPKMMPYPEQVIVAALARRLERPGRGASRGDGPDRASDGHAGGRAGDRSRGAQAPQPPPAGGIPADHCERRGLRHRRVRAGPGSRAGAGRLLGAAPRAGRETSQGRPSAARHRRL